MVCIYTYVSVYMYMYIYIYVYAHAQEGPEASQVLWSLGVCLHDAAKTAGYVWRHRSACVGLPSDSGSVMPNLSVLHNAYQVGLALLLGVYIDC